MDFELKYITAVYVSVFIYCNDKNTHKQSGDHTHTEEDTETSSLCLFSKAQTCINLLLPGPFPP